MKSIHTINLDQVILNLFTQSKDYYYFKTGYIFPSLPEFDLDLNNHSVHIWTQVYKRVNLLFWNTSVIRNLWKI